MLDRFVAAQSGGVFEAARDELVSGHKTGHWIWFVFPQLDGLGSSSMASRYAIASLDEAVEYLHHPILGPRLMDVTAVVAEQLRSGTGLRRLMGSQVDALKLVSSLTLFLRAADSAGTAHMTFGALASDVLAMAEMQGFARCQFTLRQLASDEHAG